MKRTYLEALEQTLEQVEAELLLPPYDQRCMFTCIILSDQWRYQKYIQEFMQIRKPGIVASRTTMECFFRERDDATFLANRLRRVALVQAIDLEVDRLANRNLWQKIKEKLQQFLP